MAKKGKNKRGKKKKLFSKKKFKNVHCSVCGMCNSTKAAKFCYLSIYKTNPAIFTSQVYPNLINAADWMKANGKYPESISRLTFSNIFCQTGVCTGGTPTHHEACPSKDKCFESFLGQVKPKPKVSKAAKKKSKKKKKDKRKVYQPYASFFCRDDKKFKLEVRRILHGDIDNEQNKDKELSIGSAGDADRSA